MSSSLLSVLLLLSELSGCWMPFCQRKWANFGKKFWPIDQHQQNRKLISSRGLKRKLVPPTQCQNQSTRGQVVVLLRIEAKLSVPPETIGTLWTERIIESVPVDDLVFVVPEVHPRSPEPFSFSLLLLVAIVVFFFFSIVIIIVVLVILPCLNQVGLDKSILIVWEETIIIMGQRRDDNRRSFIHGFVVIVLIVDHHWSHHTQGWFQGFCFKRGPILANRGNQWHGWHIVGSFFPLFVVVLWVCLLLIVVDDDPVGMRIPHGESRGSTKGSLGAPPPMMTDLGGTGNDCCCCLDFLVVVSWFFFFLQSLSMLSGGGNGSPHLSTIIFPMTTTGLHPNGCVELKS